MDDAGLTVYDHAQEQLEMRSLIAAMQQVNEELQLAVRNNDLDGVKAAIEEGADVTLGHFFIVKFLCCPLFKKKNCCNLKDKKHTVTFKVASSEISGDRMTCDMNQMSTFQGIRKNTGLVVISQGMFRMRTAGLL